MNELNNKQINQATYWTLSWYCHSV